MSQKNELLNVLAVRFSGIGTEVGILDQNGTGRKLHVHLAIIALLQTVAARISALLEGDETYRCLLTVPGIGPKTASNLAISIDIGGFPSHDGIASHYGLAPRNR